MDEATFTRSRSTAAIFSRNLLSPLVIRAYDLPGSEHWKIHCVMVEELHQRRTFSLGTSAFQLVILTDTRDEISVEILGLERTSEHLKLLTELERSATDDVGGQFQVLELKMSFLLSNVLAAPADGLDLSVAVDCNGEESAESCLTCELGYLMNIAGFVMVVVVVAVRSKQKEKVDDRQKYFWLLLRNLLVYCWLC